MALETAFSATDGDFRAVTGAFGTSLMLTGKFTQLAFVTKGTGDMTGTIDLTGVEFPQEIYALVTADAAGAAKTEAEFAKVAFTRTDRNSVALSELGDWTAALLFVTGVPV